MTSWIHWNLGAIRPYLPEITKGHGGKSSTTSLSSIDWRASSLPNWVGPEDFNWMDWEAPKGQSHRWLPVRGRKDSLKDTPIKNTEYSPLGNGWKMWQIGAQEHYSFLENLERNLLDQYKFHLWDFQYQRMGIQFIAITGADINAAKPIDRDDEQHFAVTMPKKLGRRKQAGIRSSNYRISYEWMLT